ncbi:hypothetical protein [Flavobacterium sp.]|uniref:hypothetical protein n=1 Tax=Flavobacterium sp. TaxID=239 RepID=UPI0038FCDED0
MKKKLEADLISIAHRVLQMKNKSDVNQLLIETQKLQEKLSVLKFVEENFGDVKPTIGLFEIEEKITAVFENNTISDLDITISKDEIKTEEIIVNESFDEEIPTNEITEKVEIEEILEDKINGLEKPPVIGFTPAFELDVEFEEEPKKKPESVQISFEDLLGGDYNETLFVKVESKENEIIPLKDLALPKDKKPAFSEVKDSTIILNETKTIKIDLNDRIAFVKHLFGNSNEDYNRVLNQLITYDSFEEVQNFIEDMVKPDYNSWEGKEDYSQRFMEIIEKKFA